MEKATTQQCWDDFPDSLARFRESWEQSLIDARAQYRESLRDDYYSQVAETETTEIGEAELESYLESLSNAEDFGIGKWIDHLLWWVPLAEALKIHATNSVALARQGFCFDKWYLCTAPHQVVSDRYGVICGPVSLELFQITAHWTDYLQRSESTGELEVVRAGTKLLFEGNAADTADYFVRLVESW